MILDPVRHVAYDGDVIWPHHRFLDPIEWEVLRPVDGIATVRHIVDDVTVAGAAVESSVCAVALWRLAVEGFVLFQTGGEP